MRKELIVGCGGGVAVLSLSNAMVVCLKVLGLVPVSFGAFLSFCVAGVAVVVVVGWDWLPSPTMSPAAFVRLVMPVRRLLLLLLGFIFEKLKKGFFFLPAGLFGQDVLPNSSVSLISLTLRFSVMSSVLLCCVRLCFLYLTSSGVFLTPLPLSNLDLRSETDGVLKITASWSVLYMCAMSRPLWLSLHHSHNLCEKGVTVQ